MLYYRDPLECIESILKNPLFVIVMVVLHDFHSTLFFILLSPTLHIHSLILSFSLSYLFP